MAFIDFIAFIAAMLFLLVSRIAKSKEANKNHPEIDLEQQEELEAFERKELEQAKKLQALIEGKVYTREKAKKPLAKAPVQPKSYQPPKDYQVKARHWPLQKQGDQEEDPLFHLAHTPKMDAYAIKKKTYTSKAAKVLQGVKSTKEMVVIHEILSKPKGF